MKKNQFFLVKAKTNYEDIQNSFSFIHVIVYNKLKNKRSILFGLSKKK